VRLLAASVVSSHQQKKKKSKGATFVPLSARPYLAALPLRLRATLLAFRFPAGAAAQTGSGDGGPADLLENKNWAESEEIQWE